MYVAALACSAVFTGCREEPAGGDASVPPTGLYNKLRSPGDREPDKFDQLRALGYVTGSQAAVPEQGVTVQDERASAGYNLYTSAHGPEAFLLDMEGRELHRWSCELESGFPELAGLDISPVHKFFRRVRLLPNGDLLAIFDYTGLIKLDKDSNLLWNYGGGAHHDLDVDEDGDIYVLGYEDRIVPSLREAEMRDNFIAILDPEGREKDRIWVSECFTNSTFRNFLDIIAAIPAPNVFHTNTLTILDGSHTERAPFFRRGNLLVSVRNLGAIGIIDPRERAFVWIISGPWLMQHEPVMLENGNMLLFDNRTVIEPTDERSSRVIEFDPLESVLYWDYVGSDETPLYSSVCGSVQRLPNGNTLVTESDFGRAFEVTFDKEIVWEFRNPHRAGDKGEFVALLPEMLRIPPDFPVESFTED